MDHQVHRLDQKLLAPLLLSADFWSMQFIDKFSSIDCSPSLTMDS